MVTPQLLQAAPAVGLGPASLLAAVVLLASCQRGALRGGHVPEGSAVGKSCRARTDAMTARLGLIDLDPPPLSIASEIELPQGKAGRKLDRPLSVLTIDRANNLALDGAAMGGEPAGLAARLRHHLEDQRARRALLAPGEPFDGAVYVAIDHRAALAAVLPVLAAITSAGVEARALLRLATGTSAPALPPSPPPPQWLADELKRLRGVSNPFEKQGGIARAAERIIANCPPLVDLWTAVAAMEPAAKGPTLVKESGAGVLACRCQGSDPDAVEALLTAMLDPGGAALRWRSLPISNAAAAPRVSMPAFTGVATLLDQLGDTTRPVQIVLAPGAH